MIQLRDVSLDDLLIFFVHQQDPDALHMAAFTSKNPADRGAFMAHWERILNEVSIVSRTILYQEQVAGHILKYEHAGNPEISYWIGRDFWGKGVATKALSTFLEILTDRPLFGRAVKDNIGSIRVLEKCGFVICAEGSGYANARGTEVEEYILRLD